MKVTIEIDKLVELLEAIQRAERADLEITKLHNQLYRKLNQVWQQAYQLVWQQEAEK